jgi:putative two-component system response regulator
MERRMQEQTKILAVDDLKLNLKLMKDILQERGRVNYLTANNGSEALTLLKEHPDTDIILLDLEMPVMNGFETLIRLKSDPATRNIPVIVITSDRSGILKTLKLGANDFMNKPFNTEELQLRVANHVRSKKLADLALSMNQVLEAEVKKKTEELQEALLQSQLAEYEISLRLGRAAEFRDLDTGQHLRRVAEMASCLGGLAGLSDAECQLLRHAAPLHDVGKIGIPDQILLKPAKLDSEEFDIIKQHTLIGGKILADAEEYPVLSVAQMLALQHHERWDGSGYPQGLSGEGIHRYSRIMAIVDVFDALTTERPYKEAFPLAEALQYMTQGSGSYFDPELLDLFLEHLEGFLDLKRRYRDKISRPDFMLQLQEWSDRNLAG